MVNNRRSLILVFGEIVLVLYQIIYQVDLMCYSSSRILSHLNGPVVPLSDMQPYYQGYIDSHIILAPLKIKQGLVGTDVILDKKVGH